MEQGAIIDDINKIFECQFRIIKDLLKGIKQLDENIKILNDRLLIAENDLRCLRRSVIIEMKKNGGLLC